MIDDCDFCGRLLEEDEETVPLYLGEIPDPKPVVESKTVDKIPRKKMAVPHHSNVDRLMGRRVDQILALILAVEGSESIDCDYGESVYEPDPSFGKIGGEGETTLPPEDFDDGINHDKVGVTIRIEPRRENIQPTMEVCEYCEKSFKGESQRPIGDIIATD